MCEMLWSGEKVDTIYENDDKSHLKMKKNLVENNTEDMKVIPVVDKELPPFLKALIKVCSIKSKILLGERMLKKCLTLLDKKEVPVKEVDDIMNIRC
ncbi:hypothetical protein QJS04_geneDACA017168 [Acorus gramineus]|uniref:Uncharacterized protein n=1 Tax=Acorus gramineus TaxID=55184 RepID=A0AAV9BPN6_ACOGR|nr:hypothetical protein QJS04_geneDACA017168 [Acorus gramineus]